MNPLKTFGVLVVGLSAAPSLLAQIEVTQGDLPQGGNTYIFQNFTPEVLVDYGSSGPSWVWDFSNLLPADSIEVDVLASTQFSTEAQIFFANPFFQDWHADHAYEWLSLPDLGGGNAPVEVDQIMGYFQFSDGFYTQVGLGVGTAFAELPVLFSDVDEIHPVPLTVDAEMTSTSAFEVTSLPGIWYEADQERTSWVDGYGTLLLPDGTSHEALRLQSTVISDDSVYVETLGGGVAFQRETTTYSWVGEAGMPLMEVVLTFGVPTAARYQGSAPAGDDPSIVVDRLSTQSFDVFPNPVEAGQDLRFRGDVEPRWTVFASNGQRVATFLGHRIRTEGWNPGVYIVLNQVSGQSTRLVVK